MLPEMAPMTVKISVGLGFFCFSLGACCAPKDGPHDCDHLSALGILGSPLADLWNQAGGTKLAGTRVAFWRFCFFVFVFVFLTSVFVLCVPLLS